MPTQRINNTVIAMNPGLRIALTCACLSFVEITEAAPPGTALRPKNVKDSITVVTSGKSRTYYPLDHKKPCVLSVKGPGDLRIITRAQFTPREDDEIDYYILYKVDGSQAKTGEMENVARSHEATYRDGRLGVPGELRDLKIPLGRGDHTIELTLKNSNPEVSARFLFARKKVKKQRWVSLTPLAPTEQVDLIANEETVRYYRFSSEKPLRIEMIGPTELRVLTRAEIHYDMKGRTHYRIRILQDGMVINSFQLASRRSEITTYKSNIALVPGKAREIAVVVPKGRHLFEIMPAGDDKQTLLGQILFPRQDVTLEE